MEKPSLTISYDDDVEHRNIDDASVYLKTKGYADSKYWQKEHPHANKPKENVVISLINDHKSEIVSLDWKNEHGTDYQTFSVGWTLGGDDPSGWREQEQIESECISVKITQNYVRIRWWAKTKTIEKIFGEHTIPMSDVLCIDVNHGEE